MPPTFKKFSISFFRTNHSIPDSYGVAIKTRLGYILHTGDIIKVNTSKSSKGPSRDWLNFVATNQAKNKIKSFFSKQERNDYLEQGSEMLIADLRKNDLPINETLSNKLFSNSFV